MKTGNIAVVSPTYPHFVAYVADIYDKAELPKTRLRAGNKISITEKGAETVFILVQYVSDARGKRFSDKVYLSGAQHLPEYDKIVQELELK